MAQNADISKYFNNKTSAKAAAFFDQTTNMSESSDSLQSSGNKDQSDYGILDESEPVVCKLFQGIDSKKSHISDPSNFFDFIAETSGGSESTLMDGNFKLNSTGGILDSFKKYEDHFTNPSSIGAPERSKDAWIPPEHTKKLLIEMITSPPGTYVPKKEFLTMPGVILEEDMKDPVYEAVNHYLGPLEAAKRKVLTASEVTQDDRGIRDLIQAGCYRAAVNLTKRLLTIYGQGAGRAGHPSKHTVHSIQLWFTRLALLVRLHLFSLARDEAEPFGELDKPDMFFQFYPELYGGRSGSMVPFSLRLLLAQLPSYTENHQLALTRLHLILFTIRKMMSNLKKGLFEDGTPCELGPAAQEESIKIWCARESRVLHSVVNAALGFKDYNLAIENMKVLMSKEHDSKKLKALQSALGRILLQMGDIVSAEKQFSAARLGITSELRDLIDSGLLAFAQNRFQDAYHLFEKAYHLDPKSITALNNMSVCLLYLGRLKDSVLLLEEALAKYPSLALHESLLLNLHKLYELQSLNCSQPKLKLLSLVNQYKGDSFNIGCLNYKYDNKCN